MCLNICKLIITGKTLHIFIPRANLKSYFANKSNKQIEKKVNKNNKLVHSKIYFILFKTRIYGYKI